jgi:hypothetical protein
MIVLGLLDSIRHLQEIEFGVREVPKPGLIMPELSVSNTSVA